MKLRFVNFKLNEYSILYSMVSDEKPTNYIANVDKDGWDMFIVWPLNVKKWSGCQMDGEKEVDQECPDSMPWNKTSVLLNYAGTQWHVSQRSSFYVLRPGHDVKLHPYFHCHWSLLY